MRVAVVSLFTPQHGETPARARTHRTAADLAARGHDVVWLCARWWGGSVQTFELDGIAYRAVLDGPSPTTFAARLPTELRAVAPDVVHAINTPPLPALAAVLAGRLGGPPVLVDWWREHPVDSRTVARHLARRASVVTTPTQTTKTRVREHGATDATVDVVPERIDVDRITDAPVDDRFDAVYSRRLDRHAGAETFLLALAERRRDDWTAAVIGDGPERDRLEAAAADLRIDDRVAFLGDRPLDERVAIFRGAHTFAQTAAREPFATELLWALACGCVGLVEYQAASSAHELVEGRERGRLVTNPAELADAMAAVADADRLSADPTFESYDRSVVLEQYLDRYRSLVEP
ncbi:glycosyltransferase [Halorubrum sp. SY-15]|jgi:glycosyltransferase involved in cell wall biosynthesis|uniref:glycosyltransferase n=1 Tax=Halorubrum sp. SY-15 TaxID=3402277 RepID=UPI003EBE6400